MTLNPDGSFTYTPTAGYIGPDSFTYRATDGTVFSAPITVAINVQPALPTAAPDIYAATSGQVLVVPAAAGVLANDTDPNGLPLTTLPASQPLHGTLTLNPDGSFTYTPNAGYVGLDAFTYQAVDVNGASVAAAVSINVQPALPTAAPDAYAATAGQALVVPAASVLANDTDPNGLPLTALPASQPLHGTLTLNPDGSFTYTPTGRLRRPRLVHLSGGRRRRHEHAGGRDHQRPGGDPGGPGRQLQRHLGPGPDRPRRSRRAAQRHRPPTACRSRRPWRPSRSTAR